MLSNGMLYYEVSGEGLFAWRSEFCVDDFVFGESGGGGTGGTAEFSGIKCGSSIDDFLSAEDLARAANNGTDLGRRSRMDADATDNLTVGRSELKT